MPIAVTSQKAKSSWVMRTPRRIRLSPVQSLSLRESPPLPSLSSLRCLRDICWAKCTAAEPSRSRVQAVFRKHAHTHALGDQSPAGVEGFRQSHYYRLANQIPESWVGTPSNYGPVSTNSSPLTAFKRPSNAQGEYQEFLRRFPNAQSR
jgi:hypothetical protein